VHPVEDFLARLDGFSDYPPDVTPVPELLPGTAAFAASAGLYRPHHAHDLPAFPLGGLMIVGHNLDSVDAYEKRRVSGISHGDAVPGHPPMSTWRNLYKMLDGAGVERTAFFFTNAFVGLKPGGPTGDVTAYPAGRYRRWCRDFVVYQAQRMQPRVILTLGEPAWTAMSALVSPSPWPPGRLPAAGMAEVEISGHRAVIVAAKHTSIAPRADDRDWLRRAWTAAV
jgi:hypothetical protein